MAHLVPDNGKNAQAQKALTENGTKLKKHTLEDVEVLLRLLALNGGNYQRTALQAETDFKIEIHPMTLKKWSVNHFPQRYAEIQRDLVDEINDRAAGKIGDLTQKGIDLQNKLLEELDKVLETEPSLSVRELTPAITNISRATESNIKQRQLLQDKPTSIQEVRTIDETIEFLERDNIIIDIDDNDIIEDD